MRFRFRAPVEYYLPISGITIFLVLTGIAMLTRPDYSFWGDYLSNLGRTEHYSSSAHFFNAGVVLAGTLSAPFFLLRLMRTKIVQERIAAAFAFLACFALAGVGIFPSDSANIPHNIAALVFFLFLAISIGLYSFIRRKRSIWHTTVYGFWTVAIILVLLLFNFTELGPALQKLAVGHALVWMAMFSLVERESFLAKASRKKI
ncbi:MAG: DUF998 domain-containing protein [Candidatus Thermoplasmatota archaeon]|nr:DUF998 domain-containing protein [Candidatus Thermoplasmatota archaeon]